MKKDIWKDNFQNEEDYCWQYK